MFTNETGVDTLVDDFGDYMSGPTSVIETLPGVPNGFELYQNYPNPFNPTTVIGYEVSGISQVKLQIFDLMGQEVAVLVDEELPGGVYEMPFDGSGLSSGTYIYALSINGQRINSRKMLLIK